MRKKKGTQWPLSEGLGALTTETGFLCADRGPELLVLGWGSKIKHPLWSGRPGTFSAHLAACLYSPELQVNSSRACGSRSEDAPPLRTQCHEAWVILAKLQVFHHQLRVQLLKAASIQGTDWL